MAEMHPLTQAIIDGDKAAATALTQGCLDDGEAAGDIIEQRLVPGMAVIGEQFQKDEIFVPEMLIAANAMKASLAILEPLIAESGIKAPRTAVIGTVQGDLHDIGKNLVAAMLEGAGFEVLDLGADVAPQQFVDAVKEHSASLIGLSALLTVTMPSMKSTIDALEEAGLREQVKVLVGGAPLSQEYAEEIHADGYADNAAAAVRMAQQLVGA